MKTRIILLLTLVVHGSSLPLQAAEVLALGDSMMKSVGRAMRREFRADDLEVEVFTSIGSGLARMDLLDWHAKTARLVNEHMPRLVFVMMGANDNQPMRAGTDVFAFGTPAWDLEYGSRAGRLMDILIEGGVEKVFWIGLPCMREQKLDSDVRSMETIVRQQADAREAVTYFFSRPLFCAGTEAYKAYVILESGMPLDVRAADGVHLNRNGAELLAERLAAAFLR